MDREDLVITWIEQTLTRKWNVYPPTIQSAKLIKNFMINLTPKKITWNWLFTSQFSIIKLSLITCLCSKVQCQKTIKQLFSAHYLSTKL